MSERFHSHFHFRSSHSVAENARGLHRNRGEFIKRAVIEKYSANLLEHDAKAGRGHCYDGAFIAEAQNSALSLSVSSAACSTRLIVRPFSRVRKQTTERRSVRLRAPADKTAAYANVYLSHKNLRPSGSSPLLVGSRFYARVNSPAHTHFAASSPAASAGAARASAPLSSSTNSNCLQSRLLIV